MRDTTQPSSAPRELESANRRHEPDRRGEANAGRRGKDSRPQNRGWKLISRDIAIVVAALVAIVFTVHRVSDFRESTDGRRESDEGDSGGEGGTEPTRGAERHRTTRATPQVAQVRCRSSRVLG
jgi:hypothetical protein